MKNRQNVLIPIDFTEASKNAVRYARFIFEHEPVNLILIHVTTQELFYRKEIEMKFNAFRNEELNGIPKFEFHIYIGNPFEQLALAIAGHHASMAVIGLKSAFDEGRVSIAQKLLLEFNCPIIAVPEGYRDFHLDKIAFANDNLREINMTPPLRMVMHTARRFGAKLFMLAPKHRKAPVFMDDSQEVLVDYLEQLENEHVPVQGSDLEFAVYGWIQGQKADLLVTPSSAGRSCNKIGPKQAFIYALAKNTSIPVLIMC